MPDITLEQALQVVEEAKCKGDRHQPVRWTYAGVGGGGPTTSPGFCKCGKYRWVAELAHPPKPRRVVPNGPRRDYCGRGICSSLEGHPGPCTG